jgi:hypothetical protein
MTTIRIAHILALLFAVALSTAGCGGDQANSNASANANSAQANSNSTKTNVEELGMTINVPYESEEVFWRDDAQHKKLVAVLRFSQPEANRLVADAEKIRAPQKVNINPESWFPPELIAQSDMSGDDTLNGKSYAANAFLQDPYKDGRIIKIDDSDYFVLELTAK